MTRALEVGATAEGKAVCENMCHSATSHSAATGAVENPRAEGYSSGGSSSGCGVLVAQGEVDMAIGADQGGSAYTGVQLRHRWLQANLWANTVHCVRLE
jgi:amidase